LLARAVLAGPHFLPRRKHRASDHASRQIIERRSRSALRVAALGMPGADAEVASVAVILFDPGRFEAFYHIPGHRAGGGCLSLRRGSKSTEGAEALEILKTRASAPAKRTLTKIQPSPGNDTRGVCFPAPTGMRVREAALLLVLARASGVGKWISP